MILSARLINCPQKTYKCEDCLCDINGPHLYLYVRAEYCDPFRAVRFCKKCADELPDRVQDAGDERKIQDAMNPENVLAMGDPNERCCACGCFLEIKGAWIGESHFDEEAIVNCNNPKCGSKRHKLAHTENN